MKRWLLPVVVLGIVLASGFVFWQPIQHVLFPTSPHSGLLRTPNSAYKYDLCTEAYAFAHATPSNPYKTEYSFVDPFRHSNDSITPHLMDFDAPTGTVNFTVDVVVNRVATFHESISHVHELDGISVVLPDKENHSQHSGVPQFIVSSLGTGTIAVLDFTCPNQWVWK
ncbi:MAG: hypothetical protein PVS3B3_02930 [Ktedonobacteraceae bacterium]